MSLSTVAHETFVIERIYDVPVAQTFRAWADPLLKARWFARSAEALGAGYELDFRVGGCEVNRGGRPGGPVYTYQSKFRDIIPSSGSATRTKCMPTSLESRCPSPRSCSAATMQRRRWSSRNRGVFLDGSDTVAQREEGTRSLPDSLAASLKSGGS